MEKINSQDQHSSTSTCCTAGDPPPSLLSALTAQPFESHHPDVTTSALPKLRHVRRQCAAWRVSTWNDSKWFFPRFSEYNQAIQSNNEKSTFPIDPSEIFQLAMLFWGARPGSEHLLRFEIPGGLFLTLQNLRVPWFAVRFFYRSSHLRTEQAAFLSLTMTVFRIFGFNGLPFASAQLTLDKLEVGTTTLQQILMSSLFRDLW